MNLWVFALRFYKEIAKFIKKLKNKFKPDKIILFGSRAKGEEWNRSDYDFIIVSSKFEGMHWLNRISKIVSLWDNLSDIDVLVYTPKEFKEKKKDSSVVREAVRHGVSLA